jgi:hypothetical protein
VQRGRKLLASTPMLLTLCGSPSVCRRSQPMLFSHLICLRAATAFVIAPRRSRGTFPQKNVTRTKLPNISPGIQRVVNTGYVRSSPVSTRANSRA